MRSAVSVPLPAAAVGRYQRLHRRGATAVEFALVAPLALLFIFASVEFGRAMFIQMVAVNAARQGSRYGALPSSSDEKLTAEVYGYVGGCGIKGAALTIKVSGNDASAVENATPGEPVEVTVTITYANNSLFAPFFLGSKALTGQVTMPKE